MIHEFWHSFFFRQWNGTSFNILARAIEELTLLAQDSVQKDMRKLKTAVIEREIANDMLYLSSKSVFEAMNAYLSYVKEVDSDISASTLSRKYLVNVKMQSNEFYKKKKDDGDIWSKIHCEFRKSIQSDSETRIVFDKLRWLWETTDCSYLPIMVCTWAMDHPFMLKLGNLDDLDRQVDVSHRFMKILETLEDAKIDGVFARDRIADFVHAKLNVLSHFHLDNASGIVELAKIENWLSEKTGLHFNLYSKNKIYLEHEFRRNKDNLCKYISDISFNPLEDKAREMLTNGKKGFFRKTSKLFAANGEISDFLSRIFLGSGMIFDNRIRIILNSDAKSGIVDRWCRHWCATYVKDSLVYSKEILCPTEQGLSVEYSCPKGYRSNSNCAFLRRVKELRKGFINQEIPDELETKFNKLARNAR